MRVDLDPGVNPWRHSFSGRTPLQGLRHQWRLNSARDEPLEIPTPPYDGVWQTETLFGVNIAAEAPRSMQAYDFTLITSYHGRRVAKQLWRTSRPSVQSAILGREHRAKWMANMRMQPDLAFARPLIRPVGA